MVKEDAERLVRELFAAYPTVELRDGTEAIYVKYLSELKRQTVGDVIPDLIRSSSKLPSIADIRNRIAEVTLGLPTPLEAYHSVFERGAELHELTRYVAEIFGGTYNIRTSDAPAAVRKQFIEFFGDLRAEAVRRAALPRVVIEAAKAPAPEPEAVEQPGIWAAVRGRFDDLPDEERDRRLREARGYLLKEKEIRPDWLAPPVIEHEALRAFADENGWLEPAVS